MVNAFVLLGATGDNAYRQAGVWTGLYEAWTNGFFDSHPTDLHVQINQGHSVDEIHGKLMNVLEPFYAGIKADQSWSCKAPRGDCEPETFFGLAQPNIWEGEGRYNAAGQAANMSYLSDYDKVISYLSIPPRAYGEWTEAMVKYWGGGEKNQIAVEKPFGEGHDSLANAAALHSKIIASGLSESNFHLTDHWVSFFMNANLPTFRPILQKALGISWSSADIGRIVVTEYEQRGFGGRGAFIDGLGQVRDMVQSHLLQVLALTMVDPQSSSAALAEAKLQLLNKLSLEHCELGQFEGLLRSKKMKFHGDFADSTFCRVFLKSSMQGWEDTDFVIQTGKSMDINLYTIEVYQKNGPGVIKYNIGKEEVGIADISVQNWKLVDDGEFEAPLPGFSSAGTRTVRPAVDQNGNGYMIKYDDPTLYFPKPYGMIAKALLTADYGSAFLSWDQCKRSWEIVTGESESVCLDPKPEDVHVYLPAFLCDKEAPEMCDLHKTVKDLYEVDYACNDQHNQWYGDVDFYKAKCGKSVIV